MSTVDYSIQKDAKFLMDYHSPRLFPVMGWSVVVHDDVIRVYDPLGRLAATIPEGREVEYEACQPEHLDLFLTEARKNATL